MNPRRASRMRSLAPIVTAILALSLLPASPASAIAQSVTGTVSFGTPGTIPAGATAMVHWSTVSTSPYASGSTVTDSAGHYSLNLAPGSYMLRFSSMVAGYQDRYWLDGFGRKGAEVLVVGSTPRTGIDQTLPSVGTISGTVSLGSVGNVASAAQVKVSYSVCYPDEGCIGQPRTSTLTTVGGAYSFPNLWTGVYTLTFALVSGTGFQPTTRVVTITDTATSAPGQNATLPTAGSIVGSVTLGVNQTPAGAGDVRVTASRTLSPTGFVEEFSTFTDAAGNYSIVGLAASGYRLHFDYVRSEDFVDEWYIDTYFPSTSAHIQVATGSVEHNANLGVAGSVSGRVTGSDGIPVAGVTVHAYTYDPRVYNNVVLGEAITANDGTFTVGGIPAASYGLRFLPNGTGHVSATWGKDPLNPQDSDVITIATGEHRAGIEQVVYLQTIVGGRVTCDDCVLRGSVWATLQRNDGTDLSPQWVSAGYAQVTTYNGAYQIRDLVPGTYRLIIQSGDGPKLEPNVTAPFELIEGRYLAVNPSVRVQEFYRDFDDDTHADVIVRDAAGSLRLFRGDGSGGWQGSQLLGTGWGRMTMVVTPGDFNSDGLSDLIARDSAGGLWLFMGDAGNGWRGTIKIGAGWNTFDSVFSPGDFDGDGNSDLIARTRLGKLYLYPGDGNGRFLSSLLIGSGWDRFTAVFPVGDFNGDDATDVMARTVRGALVLFAGDGSGGWQGASVVGSGWQNFTALSGVGDFSGDGNPDVIARTTRGDLFLFRGNGAGSWSGSVRIAAGWGSFRITS